MQSLNKVTLPQKEQKIDKNAKETEGLEYCSSTLWGNNNQMPFSNTSQWTTVFIWGLSTLITVDVQQQRACSQTHRSWNSKWQWLRGSICIERDRNAWQCSDRRTETKRLLYSQCPWGEWSGHHCGLSVSSWITVVLRVYVGICVAHALERQQHLRVQCLAQGRQVLHVEHLALASRRINHSLTCTRKTT